MNQIATRYGGFMGIALVLVNLLFYLMSVNAFFQYAGLVGFVIYIAFMVRAGLDQRKELGGYMSFAEAFKVTFQSFLVGSLIYWLFYYILFNFIDPSLAEEQKRMAMEAMEKIGSLMGEENFEKMLEAVEEQSFQVTVTSVLTNFLTSLIFPGAIFALIISLFIKKKHPDEVSV